MCSPERRHIGFTTYAPLNHSACPHVCVCKCMKSTCVLRARRFGGYSAAFAQLHNAARPSEDPTPDVHDPQRHLAAELARFSQARPRRRPWPAHRLHVADYAEPGLACATMADEVISVMEQSLCVVERR